MRFLRAVIGTGDVAAVGTGIDDFRVVGIRGDVTTLAAADVVKIGAVDATRSAGAGDGDRGVVLLRPVEPVWEARVGNDVIELGRRLIHEAGPTRAAVG